MPAPQRYCGACGTPTARSFAPAVSAGRRTLRLRLNLVVLQWFMLFVIVVGTVWLIALPGIRKDLVDERLLLARTIAHSLDTTISDSIQGLGRLAADLPVPPTDAEGRLRAFRFQSPFSQATYILDERGQLISSAPVDVTPLPVLWLGYHEAVTPVVFKPGPDPRPVVAIIQPFKSQEQNYYLVSEMNPLVSVLNVFLNDLEPGPSMYAAVVDENGVVVASSDSSHVLRTLPAAEAYGDRIRAHRPLVMEGMLSEFEQPPEAGLTVMAPLRFAAWGVVIQQRNSQAFGGVYATNRGLLITGLVLVVMGVLLARTLSRSVVRPIRQLSRQAETMRAGDLSAEITVSGDREIAVLAKTLDEARVRLASTLGELQAFNERLEKQVAARTRTIEAKYLDLTLLHTVSQLSTQEQDPDRIVPEILHLIATHYGFPAVAMVTRPPDRASATFVEPPGGSMPWLASGEPPDDWQRRAIVYRDRTVAELFHPRLEPHDDQVMGALEHQLATSLEGAYLWKRAVEQDEQRQVLVRRLLGATEDERRRLARELHDEIAQLLTVIQLSLHAVNVDTPEMKRANDLLIRTQEEIHRIIHDLRPSLLDDLGLPTAMKSYAQDHLMRQGVNVSLEIEDDLPSRPEIETVIFRIYQELVTNILRHAQAEHVFIELYEQDGKLVLAAEDDGRGFDPEAKSWGAGITGMRERAALVNGTIRFDTEAGMGTHVVVEIPLQ